MVIKPMRLLKPPKTPERYKPKIIENIVLSKPIIQGPIIPLKLERSLPLRTLRGVIPMEREEEFLKVLKRIAVALEKHNEKNN